MSNRGLVLTVDGPAGAGKSTIAKRAAKLLKLKYIDTGAMYRALTYKIMISEIEPDDKKSILDLLETTNIDIVDDNILLDGTRVDEEIRKNIISKNVSIISKIKEVRDYMVKSQRKLANPGYIIMDGRDIGTVVLPDANYKFFITATVEERARRRYRELIERQENNISYQQILKEIKIRDEIDSTREIAPLRKSPDAYLIDTTDKTIEQCVDKIIAIVERG